MAPRLLGKIFKVSLVFEIPNDLDTKKTTPNIEGCSESLRVMLEYSVIYRTCSIEHCLCRDLINAYLYLIRYLILYSIQHNLLMCHGKMMNLACLFIKKRETAVLVFILSLVLICYSCMNKEIC